jgi:hypothetical protein
MSLRDVVIEGTLKPDGTLVLDEKPSLPPGRVRVVVQTVPETPPPSETLVEFVQRSRRELEAAGSRFMNEQEVNAHIEWLREGDYIDAMLRQSEEGCQRQEGP